MILRTVFLSTNGSARSKVEIVNLETLRRNRPTLEEFVALAGTEFAFLTSQFGFVEQPLPHVDRQNEFQLRFVSPVCRVVVEGRNYGVGICVRFERSGGEWARLLDILALRCPAAAEPLRHFNDQRMLLHHAAQSVQQHALDAVRGEPDIYRAATAHLQQMRVEHSS